jgi:pilus assembly protein CpaB
MFAMKSRAPALAIAVILALVATGGVFLYVQSVRHTASTGGGMVSVIVSKQDIPAGTRLDGLVSGGVFTTVSVPRGNLVQGVVTDVNQLQGQTTAFPILANEQISTARFKGETEALGGRLGIPDGAVATTVSLDAQRIVGGTIQQGDHVTLYGTYEEPGKGSTGQSQETRTIVPDVRVLGVATSTSSSSGSPETLVTLALHPYDSELVVYTQEQGHLWMSLLPPNQQGVTAPPVKSWNLVR